MSSLSVFEYNSNSVRIIEKDGEPWFVAKDLCAILEIKNSRDALTRLDDDEKQELTGQQVVGLTDNPNITRLSVVSESGMYALVLSSRKPEAKPFRKWVTSEVLPSIRKTGQYAIAPTSTPTTPLPPADVRFDRLMSNLKELGVDIQNPRYNQALQDYTLNILGVKALPESTERWVGVVERAEELGFSQAKKPKNHLAI